MDAVDTPIEPAGLTGVFGRNGCARILPNICGFIIGDDIAGCLLNVSSITHLSIDQKRAITSGLAIEPEQYLRLILSRRQRNRAAEIKIVSAYAAILSM